MTNREKLQETFPNMIFIGTVMMYKPTDQVLASGINYNWLNAEYEIPTSSTTKNNLEVDCISRAEVKKIAKETYLEVANMELDVNTISDCTSYASSKCREVLERKLQALPPVTPQEPRVHAKILIKPNPRDEYSTYYHCSNCNEVLPRYYDKLNYCPNCGACVREEEK